MWRDMKWTVFAIGFVVFLIFGISAIALLHTKIFAPAEESVRNETYQHSTAHVEGTIRTLRKYAIEYRQTSDPAAKAAIKTMLISEFNNIDLAELPPDLKKLEDEVSQ